MDAINIPQGDIQKLLGAASGDAALLYIYLKSGGELAMAADALQLNEQRFSCAFDGGDDVRQIVFDLLFGIALEDVVCTDAQKDDIVLQGSFQPIPMGSNIAGSCVADA